MTEEEWLSATDPTPMLEFLRGKASDRKLRLFACACVRRAWEALQGNLGRWSDVGHQSLVVAERFADGTSTADELLGASDEAAEMCFVLDPDDLSAESYRADRAAHATLSCLGADRAELLSASTEAIEAATNPTAERTTQSLLLRCIFNPFATPLDPHWQTSTVLALAQGIYTDRAFDRLPILADALQDASCDNPDLLNHLRSEGPHTRGCWALDLCLNRE